MARAGKHFFKADAGAAKFAVSTVPADVYLIEVSNVNVDHVYLQLFDAASADVTVGTTPPTLSLFVPPGVGATDGAAADKVFTVPIHFSTAITAAVTTQSNNNGAPASSSIVNVSMQPLA